jgi:integrase
VRGLRKALHLGDQKTIEEAMHEYEKHMKDDRGNKAGSIWQTHHRLSRFFPDLDLPLVALTDAKCADYYEKLRKTPKQNGKPVSVDFHRNVLAEARSFLKWCLTKKKWIDSNPLDGVEGVGRRKHGKAQLRIDEARRWLGKATDYADAGHDGAIAAMVTLLMGLRSTETITRVARDVDDNGKLLWIPDSKTEAGRRTLQVPEGLQPYLLQLAKDKQPNELIFGKHLRGWPRWWVQKICREAKVPVVTAHGMRGLHSTLAVDSGVTSHAVAAALGHESFSTTKQSYTKPGAIAHSQQNRVLRVLAGGASASHGSDH